MLYVHPLLASERALATLPVLTWILPQLQQKSGFSFSVQCIIFGHFILADAIPRDCMGVQNGTQSLSLELRVVWLE